MAVLSSRVHVTEQNTLLLKTTGSRNNIRCITTKMKLSFATYIDTTLLLYPILFCKQQTWFVDVCSYSKDVGEDTINIFILH